jgi:NAD(P)-dependent dehydrogenase (short-subunit alcohol dehydrogenase family)
MEIRQKGCVVTGAGSGIGRGIALALADAGARGIVVADVQLDRAEAVCAELEAKGTMARSFLCDVRRSESVEQLAELAWRELGHVENPLQQCGRDCNRCGIRYGRRRFALAVRSECVWRI